VISISSALGRVSSAIGDRVTREFAPDTNMPVVTGDVRVGASALVPASTRVASFRLGISRPIRWCGVDGTLDPKDVEIGDSFGGSEQEVAVLSASNSDSFVEIDDSGVEGLGESSEQAFDIRAVVAEFLASVGKNVGDGVSRFLPSDDPLAMGVHGASRFRCPHDEFDVSESFGPFLVVSDVVSASEDIVEVDRSTGEEIVPFGRWEFGTTS
jgi:hypothetical protein